MSRLFISRRRRRLLAFSAASIVLLLFASGLSDHLFARSFSYFEWPPYVNVLQAAELAIAGKAPTIAATNAWYDLLPALVRPQCPNEEFKKNGKRLLIIVKSALDNVENRNAIRATWARVTTVADYRILTLFVLGARPGGGNSSSDIVDEAKKYGDMAVFDSFEDVYTKNTIKLAASLLLWHMGPASGCHGATPTEFLLLIDDDYMLSPWNLVALLRRRNTEEPLYEGWRFDTSPFRLRFHKHRISLSLYPFRSYPPYISAGAVLLSRHSASRFFFGSMHVAMLPFDDVYAGIVAKLLGISPRHNDKFLFWPASRGLFSRRDSEWADTVAAHGFTPEKQIEEFPHIRSAET